MADITVTAANVALVSGSKQTGIAGETVTAGQSLYLKAADDRLWLADTDSSAATTTCIGIALNNASAAQPLTYAGSGATVNMGATLVVGVYVLSGTAGGVAPVADLAASDWVTILGTATTTANLALSIQVSGAQVA